MELLTTTCEDMMHLIRFLANKSLEQHQCLVMPYPGERARRMSALATRVIANQLVVLALAETNTTSNMTKPEDQITSEQS